jgi:16S rRNA (uracil1498-N3)-methyltransferase
MNARFYAPDAQAPGQLVALPDDEAQHLTRVLRLGAGDAIHVFNGRGAEFEARVERAVRAGVEVRVGDARTPAPEPRVAITLVQAVLKGDKMDDVVRDAVMIGVASIQPVITARTEMAIEALRRGHRRTRWQRVAVASAKQCGRAVVPEVREPVAADDLPQMLMDTRLPGPGFLLVEPGAGAEAMAISELDRTPPREASIVIGPEGGWAQDEVVGAAGPCRPLTLGGRTIRADAMALVPIAALFARWEEF